MASWSARITLLAGALLTASVVDSEEVPCTPLCGFDAARTGRCHISKAYATALVEFFDDGPWSAIMKHHMSCESNINGPCDQVAHCEVDGAGMCAASRSWVVAQLARPGTEGGANLTDRCGLFGRLLADGAVCLQETNSTLCSNVSTPKWGGPGACAWDDIRQVCDVSSRVVMPTLRQYYSEDLVLANFLRQNCSRASTSDLCSADCHWDGNSCSLRPVDFLLAVSGDDCPLSLVFQQNAGCHTENTSNTCSTRKRADGLQECLWRQNQCEAHPVALEFDLLMFVGLGDPLILEPARAAEAQCSELPDIHSCLQPCAPAIMNPSRATRRTVSLTSLLGLAVAVLSCFLWEV
mmetsp:Transcript_74431/g.241684  ORF Transcript_74431/g.241684 Transcript_74431/m.241684 type:complete len:351 (-) Transcript_74431:35-1087(-)